jgi:lipoprotein-anchoring transpeptidase ErfK/SrfK
MMIERGLGREGGRAASRAPGCAAFDGLRAIAGTMLAVAALIAGCSANSVTAPAEGDGVGGPSPVGGPSRILGVGTNLTSSKTQESPLNAAVNPDFSTSTETTFPVTEVVINTCYNNEAPVLNGWMKVRDKTSMENLTLKYKQQTWKDTRGVVATVRTYWDDDKNPATPPKPVLVKYRNRNNTLDKFVVGPAGLPFSSVQESVMLLERLSPEHGMRYNPDDDSHYVHGPGDDLFVYAKQGATVDYNGVSREQTVFRTECR